MQKGIKKDIEKEVKTMQERDKQTITDIRKQVVERYDDSNLKSAILEVLDSMETKEKKKSVYKVSKKAHKTISGLDTKGSLLSLLKLDIENKDIDVDDKQLSMILKSNYDDIQTIFRFAVGKTEMKFFTILSYMMYKKEYLSYDRNTSTYNLSIKSLVDNLYPNITPTKKSNKIADLVKVMTEVVNTTYKYEDNKKIVAINLIPYLHYNKQNHDMQIIINPLIDFNKQYKDNVRDCFQINYKRQLDFIDKTHSNDSFSRYLQSKIITFPSGDNLVINIYDIEKALPIRCNTTQKRLKTIQQSLDLIKACGYIESYRIDIKEYRIYFVKKEELTLLNP